MFVNGGNWEIAIYVIIIASGKTIKRICGGYIMNEKYMYVKVLGKDENRLLKIDNSLRIDEYTDELKKRLGITNEETLYELKRELIRMPLIHTLLQLKGHDVDVIVINNGLMLEINSSRKDYLGRRLEGHIATVKISEVVKCFGFENVSVVNNDVFARDPNFTNNRDIVWEQLTKLCDIFNCRNFIVEDVNMRGLQAADIIEVINIMFPLNDVNIWRKTLEDKKMIAVKRELDTNLLIEEINDIIVNFKRPSASFFSSELIDRNYLVHLNTFFEEINSEVHTANSLKRFLNYIEKQSLNNVFSKNKLINDSIYRLNIFLIGLRGEGIERYDCLFQTLILAGRYHLSFNLIDSLIHHQMLRITLPNFNLFNDAKAYNRCLQFAYQFISDEQFRVEVTSANKKQFAAIGSKYGCMPFMNSEHLTILRNVLSGFSYFSADEQVNFGEQFAQFENIYQRYSEERGKVVVVYEQVVEDAQIAQNIFSHLKAVKIELLK